MPDATPPIPNRWRIICRIAASVAERFTGICALMVRLPATSEVAAQPPE